jgi:hypothetical protein
MQRVMQRVMQGVMLSLVKPQLARISTGPTLVTHVINAASERRATATAAPVPAADSALLFVRHAALLFHNGVNPDVREVQGIHSPCKGVVAAGGPPAA